MILWLNGAFGVGKTQTAFALYKRLQGAFVFDPENFGYFLRENMPKSSHLTDFQDEPLWRMTNGLLLAEAAARHQSVTIVPMTVVNKAYLNALLAPAHNKGIPVKQYVLIASRAEVTRRIRTRGPRRDSWALSKLDRCLSALADPFFGEVVMTDGLTVSEAAEEIARRAGLSLLPLPSGLRQAVERFQTALRHIRN